MRKTPVIALTVLLVLIILPCYTAPAAPADYDKGVAFLRAGKSEDAIRLLEPLKRADPANPYLFYHLGLAYYNVGRNDDSYEAFDEAARLAGTNGQLDELGLDAAFITLGTSMYRAGEFPAARKSLERGLGYSPGDGEALYFLGLTLAELGEFGKAGERLDQAEKAFGADEVSLASARNARGILGHKMGDNRAAIDSFRSTLELDPANVEALYYLGRLTYMEEGYAAARPYFDRIVNLSGSSDEDTKDTLFTTFFNMGVDFQDRGKSSNAAEMFARALSIRPGDAEARYYLGYNYMALGRYADAYDEFRQTLDMDPTVERARAQMEVAGKFAAESAVGDADARMARGDYYAALPMYEKAASLDPGSARVRDSLATARASIADDIKRRASEVRDLLKSGAYLEAKAKADELMSLAPASRESLAVQEDVSKAMTRATRDFASQAQSAESDKNLALAARYYKAMLDIDPADQSASAGLRRAESRIDDTRRLAASAMDKGLYLEAKDAYSRLLVYVPGDPAAAAGIEEADRKLALELALALKNANSAFGQDDYTMAAHHASRAIELDPDNAEALGIREKITGRSREMVLRYVREGDGYAQEGMLEKAKESYESALLLDPENDSAKRGIEKASYKPVSSELEERVRQVYLKGVEHYTDGDLEKAIEAWREVLKIDPSNEKASSSIKRAEEKLRQTSN